MVSLPGGHKVDKKFFDGLGWFGKESCSTGNVKICSSMDLPTKFHSNRP